MHRHLHPAPALVLLLTLGACVSIPGETLAPSGTQRQIRDRIYAHARSLDPQCSQQAITNTEVLELHPGGRVAEERWTLESYAATGMQFEHFRIRDGLLAALWVQAARVRIDAIANLALGAGGRECFAGDAHARTEGKEKNESRRWMKMAVHGGCDWIRTASIVGENALIVIRGVCAGL